MLFTRLVLLFLLSNLSGFALSHTDTQLEREMLSCASQTDSLKRLLCYDNLSKIMLSSETAINVPNEPKKTEQAIGAKTKEIVIESNKPANVPQPPVLKQPKLKQDDKGKATVKSPVYIIEISESPRKMPIYVLSDGTKWLATEASQLRLEPGDEIKIKKRLFGGQYLGKVGLNSNVNVKQL